MKKFNSYLVVFTFLIVLSLLIFSGCPKGTVLSEINRCLFINYKIDQAKQELSDLDKQMALAHGYQVFEIERLVYNFTKDNGQVLKTLIWYPKNKIDPSPTILFSHGFTTSAESQLYLTEGLARRGNIVIAADHLDNISIDRIGFFDSQRNTAQTSTDFVNAMNLIIGNLIQGETVDYLRLLYPLNNLPAEELAELIASGEFLHQIDNLFHYRVEDLVFLTDEIQKLNESDPILRGKMDLNRFVLGGHSLGGYATIYLARDPHPFKALLCLSPYTQPFTKSDLAKINVPVFYMSGDLDDFHNNVIWSFENTASSKVFQNIYNGGHITFTDRPFLYGLGLPFVSKGEVGFTNNLPFDKNGNSTSSYPTQLEDYQGKALTILKGASAFITAYVDNDKRGLAILNSMSQDSFITESIME
ncbi:MAG: alpha/beta fold hydrolase [Patescibacteria group bacterium]